jgi:hypothetical protein
VVTRLVAVTPASAGLGHARVSEMTAVLVRIASEITATRHPHALAHWRAIILAPDKTVLAKS